MSASWKVALPCTRAEAEAIDAGELAIDAVILTSEAVVDDPERWQLDVYFDHPPVAGELAVLRGLVANDSEPVVEALADEDWVTLSQAGLEPIREGRFVVLPAVDDDAIPGPDTFVIPASQAFGTGHHETTSGCLAMLDRIAGQAMESAIDVGTGTGLLAFAAARLWPAARIVATDIDPKAIAVTRENAARNRVEGLTLVVADGALSDAVTAAAPYDLVIANILAGPLVSMAPELAAIAAGDATIVLAGLLDTQRPAVVAAFAACGCTLEEADRRGDWTILRLRAGSVRYVPDRPFDPKGRADWPLDL